MNLQVNPESSGTLLPKVMRETTAKRREAALAATETAGVWPAGEGIEGSGHHVMVSGINRLVEDIIASTTMPTYINTCVYIYIYI